MFDSCISCDNIIKIHTKKVANSMNLEELCMNQKLCIADLAMLMLQTAPKALSAKCSLMASFLINPKLISNEHDPLM